LKAQSSFVEERGKDEEREVIASETEHATRPVLRV